MRQQWQLWQSRLNPQECNTIITACQSFPAQNAGIFEGSTPVDSVRRSTVRWVNDRSIDELLMRYAMSANREVFGFDIVHPFEVQFTEYHGDHEGFYDWHHDIHWESDRMYDRKLSVVIQLSDPTSYEGGDFQFRSVESPNFRPQGSILVFPSYLEHKVTPVTSGVRYSLVTWVEGPRWK